MILLRVWVFSLLLSCSVTMAKRGGGSHGRGRSRSRSASAPRFTRKYAKTGSIERTSLFRSTVFGAAAGYLTFRAGRHIINDPYQPIMFGSRSYYWNADLQQPTKHCRYTTRMTPVLRKSPMAVQKATTAAGYDCCQEGTFFTSLFRLLVFILVMSVLGVICIEAFRWALNCIYMCKYGHPRDVEPLSI
ncbi:hypothetical protein OSTOST_13368 [Ostertagia ostertagi]